MSKIPKFYKICSCGTKLSPTSKTSIKRHRELGYTVPMKKYYTKTDKEAHANLKGEKK